MRGPRSAWIAVLMLGATACSTGGSPGLFPGFPSNDSVPVALVLSATPRPGLLSATVTMASITLDRPSGTDPVLQHQALFNGPQTIEMTGLAGGRLALGGLQPLTATEFAGATVTVTAASVAYLDAASGQPVQLSATLGNGVNSISFPAPVSISALGGTELRINFDLAKSFTITSGQAAFQPVVTATIAPPSLAPYYFMGSVFESHALPPEMSLTPPGVSSAVALLNFDVSTAYFDSGTALASIQTGAVLNTRAVGIEYTSSGLGKLIATEVDPLGGGTALGSTYNDFAWGRVLSVVRDGTGALTSFTLVTRGGPADAGTSRTVNLAANCVFVLPKEAKDAGVAGFDSSQVFPGQSVLVAGAAAAPGQGALAADEIHLYPSVQSGALAAAAQGTAPNLSLAFAPPAQGVFAVLNPGAVVAVKLNASSGFGDNLTAAQLAGLVAGAQLWVRGYLVLSGGSYSNYAVFLDQP